MTSKELFDKGYAIPGYDIKNGIRHWRYREETYTLPWNAVPLVSLSGVRFHVAKIETVLQHSKKSPETRENTDDIGASQWTP